MALGGAFATWGKVQADQFQFIQGSQKICEKTPGIRRGFCGDCGTTLTYAAAQEVEGQDWSGDAWFSAVTLDDPAIVKPQTHVFTSHRQPWIVMCDGLPEFEEF